MSTVSNNTIHLPSPLFKLPPELRLEIYSQSSAFTLLQLSHVCRKLRHEINGYPGMISKTYGYSDPQTSMSMSDGKIKRATSFQAKAMAFRLRPTLVVNPHHLSIYYVRFLQSAAEVKLYRRMYPMPEKATDILMEKPNLDFLPAQRYEEAKEVGVSCKHYVCASCGFCGDFGEVFHSAMHGPGRTKGGIEDRVQKWLEWEEDPCMENHYSKYRIGRPGQIRAFNSFNLWGKCVWVPD
ncbi:hypothetical protein BJ508DRAFT_331702 [Ascobolus immersus RN42]|uniref:F-box domain-containing protein n=1 Tax=Ascobolus immersus RN42 TaxID=1160509 RepID=A0A3N4HRH0_ASCIM|nr:hypothetical protein BJ508DRAFT_331702 [Ascobolus immersus RN42]